MIYFPPNCPFKFLSLEEWEAAQLSGSALITVCQDLWSKRANILGLGCSLDVDTTVPEKGMLVLMKLDKVPSSHFESVCKKVLVFLQKNFFGPIYFQKEPNLATYILYGAAQYSPPKIPIKFTPFLQELQGAVQKAFGRPLEHFTSYPVAILRLFARRFELLVNSQRQNPCLSYPRFYQGAIDGMQLSVVSWRVAFMPPTLKDVARNMQNEACKQGLLLLTSCHSFNVSFISEQVYFFYMYVAQFPSHKANRLENPNKFWKSMQPILSLQEKNRKKRVALFASCFRQLADFFNKQCFFVSRNAGQVCVEHKQTEESELQKALQGLSLGSQSDEKDLSFQIEEAFRALSL